MEEFKYYIDRKVICIERETIWVEAENKKDANRIAKEAALLGSSFVDTDADSEFEILYETLNGVMGKNGDPIVEVIDAKTNVRLYVNE